MALNYKTAQTTWLSWVLLIALIIVISTMVLTWGKDFTKRNIEDTKKRVLNTELCDNVGIVVNEVYYENPQNLYIQVLNSYNIVVTKLLITQFSGMDVVYGNGTEKQIIIKPNMNKSFTLSANAVKGSNNEITAVEIVPVTEKQGYEIVCEDKSVRKEFS